MPGFFKSIGNFFGGTPEKHKRVSTLTKGQQPLADQAIQAGMGPGAGGAFGTAADYYRNLMSDDSADYQAFAAPGMRQFNEDILPQIYEQFAGMGSGGLSSSGFRNAAVNAGTDLAERLGAIRANLRQSGAAGLANIGQLGLQPMSQDVMTQQGSQGLIGQLGPAISSFISPFAGKAGNWFGGGNVGRNSSPYGRGQ